MPLLGLFLVVVCLLGSMTGIYAMLLGLPIVVLHLLIARAVARTARRGFVTRPSTFVTLILAWLCFAVLGLTIPDRVDGVWHTIITGDTNGIIGMAIGISNPMGIIGVGMCVASLIFASLDARGPCPSEDDLYDESASLQP